jgi:hypothetical protein
MTSSEAGRSKNRGSILDLGKRSFCSRQFSEEPTQPPIHWVQYFPGGKGAGYEANQLPPSSAEDKDTWIYTSTPPYGVTAWCWISQAQRGGSNILSCTFIIVIGVRNGQPVCQLQIYAKVYPYELTTANTIL